MPMTRNCAPVGVALTSGRISSEASAEGGPTLDGPTLRAALDGSRHLGPGTALDDIGLRLGTVGIMRDVISDYASIRLST